MEQKDEKPAKKETAAELTARAMGAAGVKKQKPTPSVSGIEKKEDYTELSKVQIPEATELAKSGDLDKAIELLLALEKKCRLGNDISTLKTTVLAMVQLCHDCGNWAKLNATLSIISKRHNQSKHAVTVMVSTTSEWLEETPDKETKVQLLTTLLEVTEGKIYVEAERATLTRQLAVIKEADGDIDKACDVMLDVYVETYGALSKQQKIDFILEQMRLTLAKKDWVRAFIVAKKVNRATLEEPDMQDLKMRFYRLLIEYHLQEKDAFELANDFHHIYKTPCVLEDDSPTTGWRHFLKSCITFLVLSPRTPMQSDMLHRVAKDDKLEALDADLAPWKHILTQFTTPEIIAFPLEFQGPLEAQLESVGSSALFTHWRTMSHQRTTQHNLHVASKYYKRIQTARLAQLLGLTTDETEEQLSTLVSGGDLYARIDRPAAIVNFQKRVSPEEALSDWASDIGSMLTLVERTCHLINKENMIHKV